MSIANKNPNKIFSDLEKNVLFYKDTERPFTGQYTNTFDEGIYCCKNCDCPLYHSSHKFDSSCGWPAFDDEIKNSVEKIPDADGRRTEIVCNNCKAHLGHIFVGEGATAKNLRHCVNSVSMNFVSENDPSLEVAIVAAGCFWGVEHWFHKLKGVLGVRVGYCGGSTPNPTYKDICTGKTGHLEALKIVFDPKVVSYEQVIKYFFEIHNYSQIDGQGNDIGSQYLSAIFVRNEIQKTIAQSVIELLENKNHTVATKILPEAQFFNAEEYHQDYYTKTNKEPYCHFYNKIF